MKRVFAFVFIFLGLFSVIFFSGVGFTGAVVGAELSFNYVVVFGICSLVFGLVLLSASSPDLEEIAEEDSSSGKVSMLKDAVKGVYGAGAGLTRGVYYGLAKPAVSSVWRTGFDAAEEGLKGIGATFKDYGKTKAEADAYRTLTGINEGLKERLSPSKNEEYAKKYEDLRIMRNILRHVTGRKFTVEETHRFLELLKASLDPNAKAYYNSLNRNLKSLKENVKQRKEEAEAERNERVVNEASPYYQNILNQTGKAYGSRDIFGEILKQHKKAKKAEKKQRKQSKK